MTTTEADMIRTELTVTTVTADMVKIEFKCALNVN